MNVIFTANITSRPTLEKFLRGERLVMPPATETATEENPLTAPIFAAIAEATDAHVLLHIAQHKIPH